VQRIGTAIGITGLRASEATICTIEGGRAIIGTDGAACRPRWYAAVLGAAGEIVASNVAPEGDADGAPDGFRQTMRAQSVRVFVAAHLTMRDNRGTSRGRAPDRCSPALQAPSAAIET